MNSTLFNEDMIYAATAMDAGYAVAYVPEAKVVHSHNLTPMQQFHRNFDLAVSQAEHPEIFAELKSEGEGHPPGEADGKISAGAFPWLSDPGACGQQRLQISRL